MTTEQANNWAHVQSEKMETALMVKFRQNPPLLASLVHTGKRHFVEVNKYDREWVGQSINDPNIEQKRNRKGKNLLGSLLDKIRDILVGEHGNEG